MLPHDDQGAGEPAVLLLHAGIADRGMWTELAEHIAAEGQRVLAVDLPGFGDAPLPVGTDAPWVDVLATADAVGIGRFVVVGCSFGAAVGMRVAALAPERIAGLLLCSTPLDDVSISEELAGAWEAEETALAAGDIGAAVEAVLDAWLLPDAPAALRERVGAMQRRAFVTQARAPRVEPGLDPISEHPAALERLDAPVLVVVGGRDRREFHDAADLLVHRLPGAHLIVISDAGHLPPLEDPDGFARAVDGLLALAADDATER